MLHLITGEPLDPKYDGGAYTADGEDVLTDEEFDLSWWYSRKTCPAIHMPRWASRILLEIVSVRVERLQDISEADALAEGVDAQEAKRTLASIGMNDISGPIAEYSVLWEQINCSCTWDANPWVWVVEFKKVTPC